MARGAKRLAAGRNGSPRLSLPALRGGLLAVYRDRPGRRPDHGDFKLAVRRWQRPQLHRQIDPGVDLDSECSMVVYQRLAVSGRCMCPTN